MVQGRIFFTYIFLFMSLFGCTGTHNTLTRPEVPQVGASDGVPQKIPQDVCDALSGNWGAFETTQGIKKQMCGDLPCGYVGPFKLSCRDGVVAGSVLLSVDSKAGKDYRSPIKAVWEEGRLTLSYINNQRCLITYHVAMDKSDLTGEYTKDNCGDKNISGSVIAKKNPFLRLKEKS